MRDQPEDMTRQQDTSDQKPGQPKRKRSLWIFVMIGGVVLVLIVVLIIYYITTGRYHEQTNDAYVKADAVSIAPRVSGYITEIFVQEGQLVQPGEPLLQIDTRTYDAALHQAQAAVANRQADVVSAQASLASQRAQAAQVRSQGEASEASLRFARAQVARFAPLLHSGADTHEHQESLQQTLQRAQAEFNALQAQADYADRLIQVAQARVTQAEAALQAAQADVEQAQIAREDTRLVSRIRGRIGDRKIQLGQFLSPGTRTMTIVPTQDIYLEANFKETQVGHMRSGQPVSMTIDALPDQTFHGQVDSLAPGTGAEFALFPPENATGNFTKVVQRVAVRIHLTDAPSSLAPLFPGLSADVTVDTHPGHERQSGASEK